MRTIGTILGTATALALTAVASPGAAQEFGKQGDAVFSAERLFGFQSTNMHWEREDPLDDVDNDWTYFGLGWRGTYISDFSPYDAPRFGFDYLVIDGLSVGGNIGYASLDGETDGGFFFGNDHNGSAFMVLGRAGYVHMFSKAIGIWPRGGLQFHTLGYEDDDGDGFSDNGFGLNIECMFPIVPSDHWGFLVGPTFDIDITGERDNDPGVTDDLRYRTFGLQVGVFGWL